MVERAALTGGTRFARMARRFTLVALVLTLPPVVLAAGCDFPGGGNGRGAGDGRGEGPGHRAQKLALSPQQEIELGRQAYREVLSTPRKYGAVVPQDRPECQRVREIARRIIRAAGIEPLQREMNIRKGFWFEWEVNVFDNREVNAFCLPGGKMAVFRGILGVAQNDSQLATVMSHEIAHALAHHSSERVARKEIGGGALGGFWSKSFDRAQESEADHIGLFLMTFAGFHPEEAVRFWESMAQATGGKQRQPEILSDHPSSERRIKQMKEWIPKAIAAKKAYDEGDIKPVRER
jgi:predicted Zn-dependent protease